MKKFFYFALIVIIFLISTNVYALSRQNVKFSACVDGDTARFILKKEEIKVRFLAVDTPESVHPTIGEEEFGKEASEYTCNRLKEAKQISIEYDPDSDKTDKYDRHLVWVYVDDSLLQKELVSKGYAEVAYLYGDYLYTNELKEEQEKSKKSKIGIWSIDEQKKTSDKTEKKTKNKTKKDNEYDKLIDEIYNILKKICEMLVDFLIDMI